MILLPLRLILLVFCDRMFVLSPKGIVIPQFDGQVSETLLYLSLNGLNLLLAGAHNWYHVDARFIHNFSRSLCFLIPVLFVRGVRCYGNSYKSRLQIPRRAAPSVLQWGAYVQWCPSLDRPYSGGRTLELGYPEESTPDTWRESLLRCCGSLVHQSLERRQECFVHGLESFRRVLKYKLLKAEEIFSRPHRTLPVATCNSVVQSYLCFSVSSLDLPDDVFIARNRAKLIRLFNNYNLPRGYVGLFSAVSILNFESWEDYFEDSEVCLLLQKS
ncbi:P0 [Dregea volubilis polerovirus 1]|nr:P0 [Dregea volubilis polerovirus 1]